MGWDVYALISWLDWLPFRLGIIIRSGLDALSKVPAAWINEIS